MQNDRALFICMDLCYISALLVEGFRIEPSAEINLAKKIMCVVEVLFARKKCPLNTLLTMDRG